MFQNLPLPSDRKFGFVFAAVFLILAWFLGGGGFSLPGNVPGIVCLALAALFFVAASLAPRCLRPLNRLWMGFGLILGKIVSPVVMGVIFFGLITPMAVISRLTGRDELKLKCRTGASHWMRKTRSDEGENTYKRQF